MGSILDDEYSLTCVVTKTAWYSSCVIWSRGGEIGSSVDGRKVWVVGWGCGRGFYGCVFVKSVYLGDCDGIFLGQKMGVRSGWDMEASCVNLEQTLAG